MDTKTLRFKNGDRVVWDDRTCEVNGHIASGQVVTGEFFGGLEWYTISVDDHCRNTACHGSREMHLGWVNRNITLDKVRAE